MWITEEIKWVYYTVPLLKKASPFLQKGFPSLKRQSIVLFSNGPGPIASKFFQQLGLRFTRKTEQGVK